MSVVGLQNESLEFYSILLEFVIYNLILNNLIESTGFALYVKMKALYLVGRG